MTALPAEMRDELLREYIASFDHKISELEKAFNARDQEKLKELFHKLAGSGKTYEMDDISNIGRLCENLLAESLPEEKIKKALELLKGIFAEKKKTQHTTK